MSGLSPNLFLQREAALGPLHATETWVNAQEILVESGKERGRKLDVHK
jgi:hypothetical protein